MTDNYHEIATLSAAGHQPTHDDEVVVVLSSPLASYVLRLVARDLGRGPRSVSRGVEEDATALAMYLGDSIPEHLRTPVPALVGRAHGTAAMQAA